MSRKNVVDHRFLEAASLKFGANAVVSNKDLLAFATKGGFARPNFVFVPENKVGHARYRLPNVSGVSASAPTFTVETDEEIEAKLADRFDVMNSMAYATATGKNRAVIISGPPGLGKSYGVHQVLSDLEAAGNLKYTVIKGFVRATGLYKTLWEHKEKGSVVVFDDADSIFFDDTTLNLLKVACDTTHTRVLSWLSETKMEDAEGERLERSFVFEGSIIFISNYDFDEMIARGHRLAHHFEAMISRCHYLDLDMKTAQHYLVRIRQVVKGGMLRDMGFSAQEETMLLDYIAKNSARLRELSLRMVLKLANLFKIDPINWVKMASVTCLKNVKN